MQPTVPELSLLMDGSFVARTAKPPNATPHLPLPTLHQSEMIGFPKAPTELNVCGQNRLSACPPVSRTVTPTMSKKGSEGSSGFSPSLLPVLSSPPKMAALPDGSSELFRQYPIVGCAQESKPFTPELSVHSQSPVSRFPSTTSGQPRTQLCMFPGASVKSVNKPCSCCQHNHNTGPFHQSQPWPETSSPSGPFHPMTPTKPTAVCCAPKSTPPKGCCLSPPHQTSHQVPVYKSPPHLDCLQHSSHTKSCHPAQKLSQAQSCQSQETCMVVPENYHNMLSVDAYRLLMDQDRQLKLLQAQVRNI